MNERMYGSLDPEMTGLENVKTENSHMLELKTDWIERSIRQTVNRANKLNYLVVNSKQGGCYV